MLSAVLTSKFYWPWVLNETSFHFIYFSVILVKLMKTKHNGTVWLKKFIFTSKMTAAAGLPTGLGNFGRPVLFVWVVGATRHCRICRIRTSHLAVQQDLFSRIADVVKYIEINLEQHARLPASFASNYLLKSAIVKNKIKIKVEFSWNHEFSSEKLAWLFYCNWLGTQNPNQFKPLV